MSHPPRTVESWKAPHPPTPPTPATTDLLEDNADLFDRAGRILKDRESHAVSITDAVSVNGSLKLRLC
ncbi:hypothetical protein, partial [Streptomyces scabiei]|uniref:hypothetical protein n=1 Tax=Streptomyces scabiei TaxID=1930 RepID=UPI000AA2682A